MKKNIIYLYVVSGIAFLVMNSIAFATTHSGYEKSDVASIEERVAVLEQSVPRGLPLYASWQDGIRLESDGGTVLLRIGGRVQKDFAAFYSESDLDEAVGPLKSGTRFRRARLYFSGSMYDHGLFRVEYDFAGGIPAFRDAYLGVQNVPVLGTVRIGRMLETYSLEQLSGNNFHAFMERGLPAAFNAYWSSGLGVNNSMFDQRATWAMAFLRSTDAFGDSDAQSGHTLSARLTAAPVYSKDGRSWLHLGVGGIQRKPDDSVYSINSRPESSLAPRFVHTGDIPSDRVELIGMELAGTHGPVTLQGEAHQGRVRLLETDSFPYDGSVRLGGYYIYAGYFITGEHRAYNRAGGTLGRVKPRSVFRGEGHGFGAWEAALRWSEINLDDDPINGGKLNDMTFGLNWYLNPNMRIMWNYVHSDLKGEGRADIIQMRAQFDF